MPSDLDVSIVDITEDRQFERFLYRCLAPMPFRKYRTRRNYLEAAIPQGFRKKILFFKGTPVGTIEFAPANASGYPIMGEEVVVLHCLWVLRKAKGYRFGTQLVNEMIRDSPRAIGLATIGLDHHWSPWLKTSQMELYGFKTIDSITVSHKTKHIGERFTIHLMWLPLQSDNPPTWNTTQLLQGIDFCMANPLYHPQSLKTLELLQRW
ncbi:MAG: GNAT family N-acetyltransferase [Promethearchaeota archaeon]